MIKTAEALMHPRRKRRCISEQGHGKSELHYIPPALLQLAAPLGEDIYWLFANPGQSKKFVSSSNTLNLNSLTVVEYVIR